MHKNSLIYGCMIFKWCSHVFLINTEKSEQNNFKYKDPICLEYVQASTTETIFLILKGVLRGWSPLTMPHVRLSPPPPPLCAKTKKNQGKPKLKTT